MTGRTQSRPAPHVEGFIDAIRDWQGMRKLP